MLQSSLLNHQGRSSLPDSTATDIARNPFFDYRKYNMNDKSHIASFRYTGAVQSNGTVTQVVIAQDVWPSLTWRDREFLPPSLDASLRHVVEDVSGPEDLKLLDLLTCPARVDAVSRRQEMIAALEEKKVLRIPWCLEPDRTVVFGPPYTSGNSRSFSFERRLPDSCRYAGSRISYDIDRRVIPIGPDC